MGDQYSGHPGPANRAGLQFLEGRARRGVGERRASSGRAFAVPPQIADPPRRMSRAPLSLALAASLLACAPSEPVPPDSPIRPVSKDIQDGPRDSVTAPVPGDSPPAPVPGDMPPAPVPGDSPPASPGAAAARPPPPGFVDLRAALPDACFTAGYAAADNFTGAPLPGYAAAGAWLLAAPAAALARVQAGLAREGLSLQIFDAYRPRRASAAMVAWAERTGQARLVADGYIARRSGHNHGHTVDLGLARRASCEPLDMGSAWDTLDPTSHTANAAGAARVHRTRLRQAMRAAGFRDYPREWWHFSFPLAGTRPLDIPYGPEEPPPR